MDNKGTIAIELAITLILIVLIFGVILSISEMSTQKIAKETEKEHIDTIINRAADYLINNPGNPNNWNENEKGTPGLAIVNEEGDTIPNSISYFKLMALKNGYDKLVTKKMFDSKVKTSMELTPKKSSISSVKIGSDAKSENVFSANRYAVCDFYKKYVIKDFKNPGKCNRDHDQKSHSCNYIKVFKGNFESSDYYLLMDESEKYNLSYSIDTTRVVKLKGWQTLSSDKIYLNDEILFYDDNNAIAFIHFDKKSPDAVLVSVPKNFDKNYLKYDYFRTNECEFTLRGWY